jgi:hypothetical protein
MDGFLCVLFQLDDALEVCSTISEPKEENVINLEAQTVLHE